MNILQTILRYITDIVDVLIVSYVFYKIMILIRGTRAIQLLQGILIIVVTWLISSVLELRTLEWLMQQAFTYGVLVILIIFQPELRRALEQLGRGRFFSLTFREDAEKKQSLVQEVVRAVGHMSRRRIGALIVLERQSGLNDYIETGTQLNATATAELLMNIFVPNTPLHDGAVILRGTTIMAGGCYLPLSESPFISKELGTRHRAGIGVSEMSDCLAVIVSEETGQISLAQNGTILRDLGEGGLAEELMRHLREERQRASIWLRKGQKRHE